MKPKNTAEEKSPDQEPTPTPEIVTGVMAKVQPTPDKAILQAAREKSIADLQAKMGITTQTDAMLSDLVSPSDTENTPEIPDAIIYPPEIREDQDAA